MSTKMIKDFAALLRSRHTLLWVQTREEIRVEREIIQSSQKAQFQVRFWDCATGISNEAGESEDRLMQDPKAVLDRIRDKKEETRMVYVLRDLHKWFTDPFILRYVRSLARDLQNADVNVCKTIVILTPSPEIPLEIQCCATAIDWPLPTREEIADVLETICEGQKEAGKEIELTDEVREAAIDAALGLTTDEAAACYGKSLVLKKTIDPTTVSIEKKRVITREKVLSWTDPDPRGLESVGGLEELKGWIRKRGVVFTKEARDYGLPNPKGCLLAGVPGCGKSQVAKAIAAGWQKPLLRLDMGALKSKYVGESEQNIRRALRTAETVAPCVLWVDEIEKALGGATQGAADGGVSADALGVLLSWMQERTASVFVVATANNVDALPAELLRKGRWDEIFFVDLPNIAERKAILEVTLRQFKCDVELIKVDQVVEGCEGFSGAEIASIVPDAMFEAFADEKRSIRTADLIKAASTVTPLSRSNAEKIKKIREWADGRCRLASMTAVSTKTAKRGQVRALDLN